MKAKIASYRMSRRDQYTNQMILHCEGVTNREQAQKLVGKHVSWVAPGANKTTIKGEIRSAHGRNGAVRVLFERGMPGQALGTEAMVN